MLQLFGIVGKMISSSGFEDVLYQANLCTNGGINEVLSGKHFNRSWVIQEMFFRNVRKVFV